MALDGNMDNLSGRSYGTLSAYTPTLREKVAQYLAQNIFGDTKDGYATARKVTEALDYTPLGLGTAAYDAGRSGATGDWLGAAAAVGTMLPVGKTKVAQQLSQRIKAFRGGNPNGRWFTSSAEAAGRYAKDRGVPIVTEADISFQNPMIVDARGENWNNIGASVNYEMWGPDGRYLGAGRKDEIGKRFPSNAKLGNQHRHRSDDGETTDSIFEKAQKLGHDGVIFRNVADHANGGVNIGLTDVYAVVDPAKQVARKPNRKNP